MKQIMRTGIGMVALSSAYLWAITAYWMLGPDAIPSFAVWIGAVLAMLADFVIGCVLVRRHPVIGLAAVATSVLCFFLNLKPEL